MLTGAKTRRGEKKVAMRVIIRKNLIPSFNKFILLLPSFRGREDILAYLIGLPLFKNAKVRVLGYEKVLGSR